MRVNHGDSLLTVQRHGLPSDQTKEHLWMSPFVLFEDNTMLEKADSHEQFPHKCRMRPSRKQCLYILKEKISKSEKANCLDFVEVDSSLSIKCTCHQTSAKVKYITLYVHNYKCSRCTNIAGWHVNGNTIITVLLCQNVNIWWMAQWWGNSPHQNAGKQHCLCHAWMWQQRLWRKMYQQQQQKEHKTFLWISRWDDQNMALYMSKNMRRSATLPCYHHASYCTWFMENESVWRRNLAVGAYDATSTSIPANKQCHPDLRHLRK